MSRWRVFVPGYVVVVVEAADEDAAERLGFDRVRRHEEALQDDDEARFSVEDDSGAMVEPAEGGAR